MHQRLFSSICLAALLLFSSVSFAAEKTVKGKITSVDADKNSITLEGVDLDVTRKTKITVDGKKATLADIKMGQQVTVTYDDGLEVATSISVENGSEKGDGETAMKALQGEWIFVEGVAAGKPIANQDSTRRIVIKGKTYMLFAGDRVVEGTLQFDDTKSPKHLDFIPEKGGSPAIAGKVQPGICELTNDGSTLRFCVGSPEGKRPSKFDGNPQGWSVQTYKKRDEDSDDSAEVRLAALKGTWLAFTEEAGGKRIKKEEMKTKKKTLKIEGDKFTLSTSYYRMTGKIKAVPEDGPNAIDLEGKSVSGEFKNGKFVGKGDANEMVLKGIYEIKDKTLRLCYSVNTGKQQKDRPTAFETEEGDGLISVSFEKTE